MPFKVIVRIKIGADKRGWTWRVDYWLYSIKNALDQDTRYSELGRVWYVKSLKTDELVVLSVRKSFSYKFK